MLQGSAVPYAIDSRTVVVIEEEHDIEGAGRRMSCRH